MWALYSLILSSKDWYRCRSWNETFIANEPYLRIEIKVRSTSVLYDNRREQLIFVNKYQRNTKEERSSFAGRKSHFSMPASSKWRMQLANANLAQYTTCYLRTQYLSISWFRYHRLEDVFRSWIKWSYAWQRKYWTQRKSEERERKEEKKNNTKKSRWNEDERIKGRRSFHWNERYIPCRPFKRFPLRKTIGDVAAWKKWFFFYT